MFWEWYETEAAPKLGLREASFRKIFKYLDSLDETKPLVIVETGCVRAANNWGGDGQSTILFDRYLQYRTGDGSCFAVDIDPKATALCRTVVSEKTEVLTGDSVLVLRDISSILKKHDVSISLLYLDSFDLDWKNPAPSAVHHLKELVSIYDRVSPQTLVVVDDSPMAVFCSSSTADSLHPIGNPVVGGKGQYVAEYAIQLGATLLFSHYQAAWHGFR